MLLTVRNSFFQTRKPMFLSSRQRLDYHETITEFKMLVFSPSRGEFLDSQPVKVLPQVHDQQQAVRKTRKKRIPQENRGGKEVAREICSSVITSARNISAAALARGEGICPMKAMGLSRAADLTMLKTSCLENAPKAIKVPYDHHKHRSNLITTKNYSSKQVNSLTKVFSRYQGMADVVQLLPCLAVDVLERGWEVVCHELVPRPVPEFLSFQTGGIYRSTKNLYQIV